jgi:hypothetical protein
LRIHSAQWLTQTTLADVKITLPMNLSIPKTKAGINRLVL